MRVCVEMSAFARKFFECVHVVCTYIYSNKTYIFCDMTHLTSPATHTMSHVTPVHEEENDMWLDIL